jgi:hypothetical protein
MPGSLASFTNISGSGGVELRTAQSSLVCLASRSAHKRPFAMLVAAGAIAFEITTPEVAQQRSALASCNFDRAPAKFTGRDGVALHGKRAS